MPYSDKSLLEDEKRRPIPQYFDKKANEFKPMDKDIVVSGKNEPLINKSTLNWDGVKLENSIEIPVGSGSPILITIINSLSQTTDLEMRLEHQFEDDIWTKYCNLEGEEVVCKISGSDGEEIIGGGTFGIIQGFPRFLGGKIILAAEEAPDSGTSTIVQVQEV